MNEKNTYTGSKIKNQFTAYLVSFIRGKRRDYLEKKIKISNTEESVNDFIQLETGIWLEELWENQEREKILLMEAEGEYTDWKKLKNDRLIDALMMLREEERAIIFQHVFEEMSFEKMSFINHLSEHRVKGIYYYAIQKIRRIMKGDKDVEF